MTDAFELLYSLRNTPNFNKGKRDLLDFYFNSYRKKRVKEKQYLEGLSRTQQITLPEPLHKPHSLSPCLHLRLCMHTEQQSHFSYTAATVFRLFQGSKNNQSSPNNCWYHSLLYKPIKCFNIA